MSVQVLEGWIWAHHAAVSGDKGHALPCSLLRSTAAAADRVLPHDTWTKTHPQIQLKWLLLTGFFCFSCSEQTAASPTCRGQHIQSLQAVFAWRRVASCLGEAALAVVQHDGWRDNARGRDFTHLQVQVLDLLLLIGLQVLHLCQVSVRRKNKLSFNSFFFFSFDWFQT